MSFLILIKYGGYEHEEKNSNAIINNVCGSFISNRYTSSKLCGKHWERDNKV